MSTHADRRAMDFEHVGAHCALKSCNRRDFLPFTCPSCNHAFCLHHRSPASHLCPSAGSPSAPPDFPSAPRFPTRTATVSTPAAAQSTHAAAHAPSPVSNPKTSTKSNPKCALGKECRNSSLVLTSCKTCARSFCIQHRNPLDHLCVPVGAEKKGNGERRVVAVGDPSVHRDDRVYLGVVFVNGREDEGQGEVKVVYVHRNWSAGRVMEEVLARSGRRRRGVDGGAAVVYAVVRGREVRRIGRLERVCEWVGEMDREAGGEWGVEEVWRGEKVRGVVVVCEGEGEEVVKAMEGVKERWAVQVRVQA